jgi:hypothetical protein
VLARGPAFHGAYGFSEGLAAVKLAHLWGYVESSGLFKIEPHIDGMGKAKCYPDVRAGQFCQGLAPVWIGQDRYRFIDREGKFAFDGEFDEASRFRDERAVVKQGNRFGYIDTEGRLAIDYRFTLARDFREGLAKVEEEASRAGFSPPCGFVDSNGQVVIPPIFFGAESFRDGLSLVTTQDKIGYINKSGELVWEGPFVEYGVLF